MTSIEPSESAGSERGRWQVDKDLELYRAG